MIGRTRAMKAHDHGNDGNTSHLDGGSNGALDDNGTKEKKGKDGNNEKKMVVIEMMEKLPMMARKSRL